MSPEYWALHSEVQRLMSLVKYQRDRDFIEQPAGWEHMRAVMVRALNSGHVAIFGPSRPNYTRLLLARDELRQVA